jgi:hypothetical protein
MNGEEVSSDYPDDDEELYYRMDAEYDEDGQYLRVSYAFPVTDEEPVEEALYRFVEGDDSFWIKGSEEPLRFVVKRSEDDASTFAHFTGIEVDGEAVAENAYTAEAGSVVLDLQPAYLESLSEDTHALTVQFDDGTAEGAFTIAEAEDVTPEDPEDVPGGITPAEPGDDAGETEPAIDDTESDIGDGAAPPEEIPAPPAGKSDAKTNTGDNSRPVLWAAVCGGSLLLLVLLVFARRRHVSK